MWIDRRGNKSEYNQCPKCKRKHYDLTDMRPQVMFRRKSMPVHLFCTCGKDMGKFN